MDAVDAQEVRRIENELVRIYGGGGFGVGVPADELQSVGRKPDDPDAYRHLTAVRLMEMGMPSDLLEGAIRRVMDRLEWA